MIHNEIIQFTTRSNHQQNSFSNSYYEQRHISARLPASFPHIFQMVLKCFTFLIFHPTILYDQYTYNHTALVESSSCSAVLRISHNSLTNNQLTLENLHTFLRDIHCVFLSTATLKIVFSSASSSFSSQCTETKLQLSAALNEITQQMCNIHRLHMPKITNFESYTEKNWLWSPSLLC